MKNSRQLSNQPAGNAGNAAPAGRSRVRLFPSGADCARRHPGFRVCREPGATAGDGFKND